MSILEAIMMVCFGASWPAAILKTIKAKNPAGKSLLFLVLIELGYLAGIVNKLFQPGWDWVIILYIVNAAMVAADLILVLYYKKKLSNA